MGYFRFWLFSAWPRRRESKAMCCFNQSPEFRGEAYTAPGRTRFSPGGDDDPRMGFGGVRSGLLGQVDVLGPGEDTKGTPKKKSGKGKDSKEPEVVDPSRSTKKSAEACTIILSTCSQQVLILLAELPTAKGQWEALRQIYASVSAMNLASTLRELSSYKTTLGSDSNVISIASKLTSLQREIGEISIREMPSDMLKTTILFKALRVYNSEFHGPLVSLELGGNMTGEAVVGRCTEIERSLPKSIIEKTKERAMEATEAKAKIKCYNCGKMGHYLGEYFMYRVFLET
ncbi:uncharacterized protein RAG0_02995 [Rhynchosporium agropyri]|uniref:CCHC-type domain-containing protein n=1 Tax=Rhynchosporium agropyri TaxID=914238 RepID=A0A1E1K2W9_9HELO|nr:uncharacterized protein RAG0_02995 [Rhynchosporium agropyri]